MYLELIRATAYYGTGKIQQALSHLIPSGSDDLVLYVIQRIQKRVVCRALPTQRGEHLLTGYIESLWQSSDRSQLSIIIKAGGKPFERNIELVASVPSVDGVVVNKSRLLHTCAVFFEHLVDQLRPFFHSVGCAVCLCLFDYAISVFVRHA